MMIIGICTVIGSLNYDVRTLARMGPGYFPLLLGWMLIGISALMVASESIVVDDTQESSDTGLHFRPWLCVIAGIILFVVLGKYGGLVPAAMVLVTLSALGDKENSIKDALLLGVFITALAAGIFHYGLKMQFPLFTWG